jgi:hypothetical protein
LRKKTFCDSVTRLLEDELQNQKPFGGHWSLLEEPQKNTAHLFKRKFPVNYRSSSKKHFKFPGNFKAYFGE